MLRKLNVVISFCLINLNRSVNNESHIERSQRLVQSHKVTVASIIGYFVIFLVVTIDSRAAQ